MWAGPVESEAALTWFSERVARRVNAPRERNWLQRSFNFGGPGWFHDVVELELVLDGDAVTREPDDFFLAPYSEGGEVAVYKTSGAITGTLRLTAPPRRRVWVSSVAVRLQQCAVTLEEWETTELRALEVVVAGTERGLYVSERVELPFKIELGALEPDGRGWHETYVGSLYSMRHWLDLTVRRPWFTYAVERRYPVYLQRVDPAPAPTAPLADGDAAPHDEPTVRRNRDLAPERPKHVLPLIDVRAESCELDYGRTNIDLSGALEGELTFERVDEAAAGGGIVSVQLEIIKLELGNADADERVLYAEMLHPPGAPLIAPCVAKPVDAADATADARAEAAPLGALGATGGDAGDAPDEGDAEDAFGRAGANAILSFVDVPIAKADPLRALVGDAHEMPRGEPFAGDRVIAVSVPLSRLHRGQGRQHLTPTHRVIFLEPGLCDEGAAESQRLSDRFDAEDLARERAREAERRDEAEAGIVLSARQENARARVWRDEDDEHEHVRVAVKYFVRVHVRDAAGHTSWNTNEVRPSRASGSRAVLGGTRLTCGRGSRQPPPFLPRRARQVVLHRDALHCTQSSDSAL